MGNKSTLPGSCNSITYSVKKIEGQDLFGGSKTNFEQKINKLKSKPNQKVLEDEYIKVFFTLTSGPSIRNQVPRIRTETSER